jgi:L-lactate dehydrogenase
MLHSQNIKLGKVTIVGAGDVGSTFAFALAQSGTATEIALTDLNTDLMQGHVLDLAHGLPFFPPVNIHNGDMEDYTNSQVIVITAGAKQRPSETRIDLLHRNAQIIETIIDDIVTHNSSAIIIVVSNPVDILTYVALKRSGFDRSKVIGSGTVLDSSRFRYMLSRHCGIDVRNVHAYILGEHGDSEVAPWSMAHFAGMQIDEFCQLCQKCDNWHRERAKIVEEVRDSAYHIIDYKGATYYAIAMALVRIVGAIIKDQRSVLTVSTLLQGEYDIEDVCLSVPCITTQQGIEQIIVANLQEKEKAALAKSASVLHDALNTLISKNLK